MSKKKKTRPKAVLTQPRDEKFTCPHCHEQTMNDGEHYSYLSYRYRCGDQWVGSDI